MQDRQASGEAGFTLIELLVVVIIIGILAAIAIPVFLNQRAKAQESAIQSDLKAAGSAASVCSVDHATFASCDTQAELKTYGFKPSSQLNWDAAAGSQPTFTLSNSDKTLVIDGVKHDSNTTLTGKWSSDTGEVTVS